MTKRLLILLLLTCSINAFARKPNVSYGLEWGYTASFLRTVHYSFVCSDGYRIVDNSSSFNYFSNGSILANVGLDLLPKLNLSVYSGLAGVWSDRWVVPVELRLRFCPAGLYGDGFICSAGASVNFPTKTLRETCFRASAGAGYRVAVFRDISVDFLLSVGYSTDHDQIIDPISGDIVTYSNISHNDSGYLGISLSAAINF